MIRTGRPRHDAVRKLEFEQLKSDVDSHSFSLSQSYSLLAGSRSSMRSANSRRIRFERLPRLKHSTLAFPLNELTFQKNLELNVGFAVRHIDDAIGLVMSTTLTLKQKGVGVFESRLTSREALEKSLEDVLFNMLKTVLSIVDNVSLLIRTVRFRTLEMPGGPAKLAMHPLILDQGPISVCCRPS